MGRFIGQGSYVGLYKRNYLIQEMENEENKCLTWMQK
jgi:hypothetical protein